MVNPSGKVDNYALDDTLAGRITQAAGAGVLTALPDYFQGKALAAAYAVGCVGFGGLVAYANAESRSEAELAAMEADVQAAKTPADEARAQREKAPGVKDLSFILPVAVVGIGAASLALDVAVSKKVAGFLRKKGVTKPWTAMGALAAVSLFAVSELEARELAAGK